MAFQPKTEPGSSPRSICTSNKKSYNEMNIFELISVLRVAFQMKDFDEVEEELVNREAKLRAEIGQLKEKIELERLNSIEAEERLKMREEQCEKGKRAQENYEQLLKVVKKSVLVENITIEELRTKNVALEREICELKEFKKKILDEGKSVAELRAKIRVLEEEKVGDKSALDSLSMKNIELEEAVRKNLTVTEGLRTENGKLTDEKNEHNLEDVGDHELENDYGEPVSFQRNEDTHYIVDAGTAQSLNKGNKDEAVCALGVKFKLEKVIMDLGGDDDARCTSQRLHGEKAISQIIAENEHLKRRAKELASQEALQTTELKRRVTGFVLEVDELRQADRETKRLLFEKSQETLRIYARNNDLCTEVDSLKKELGSKDEKIAQAKEALAKLEEEVARLKEEVVRKDELFQQTKYELSNDAADAYGAGFEDAMAQVACVYPGMDLSQIGLTKTIVDGQLVDAEYQW